MAHSSRDNRDTQVKASKEGKQPSCYSQKVDSSKVNLPVIKRWIEEEITAQLPDDDIAVGYIYELIAGEENPDILALEAQVDEFLGKKDSRKFCKQLWKHLLSAQEDKDGIPQELVEQRKKMLEEQKKASERLQRESASGNGNRGWYQRERRDRFGDRRQHTGNRGSRDNSRYDGSRANNDDRRTDTRTPRPNDKPEASSQGGKTNYNRMAEASDKQKKYEEDHHDARERGPRDRTVF